MERLASVGRKGQAAPRRSPWPFMLLLSCGLAAGCGPQAAPRGGPAKAADARPAPAPATAPAGQDFGDDARLIYRVAACAGDAPLPAALDAQVVEAHCAALRPLMDQYRQVYLREAQPFLARLRPADLGRTVVYPFGGGDLLSALTAYPDATEITTLSLEYAGDPRRARALDKARLEKDLALLRRASRQVLTLDDSASDSLIQTQRGGLPGQLSFFLIGLAVHGYEPVSLRYFKVEDDGGVHYLSKAEVRALEGRRPPKLNSWWKVPDFSPAFANLELTFRPAGAGPDAPLRVHRHIAADLGDDALRKDPRVLRHLEAKGHVAALVKAASYLLWADGFGRIRDYLLAQADFIFSDSSGIPPRYSVPAGFVLETYGRFEGTFIPSRASEAAAFRKLWREQPLRELPFRFGYADVNKHPHLLVSRRAPRAP